MKQKYEAIFIIRCNEDSKKLEETIEKINNIVISNSFNIYYKENKGEKKLAYEVKGEKEGVYYYIKFENSENQNYENQKSGYPGGRSRHKSSPRLKISPERNAQHR